MKPQKLLKQIQSHKFGDGTTFYIKEDGEITFQTLIKYKYDKEVDCHGLYMLELQYDKNGVYEICEKSELKASMLINSNIRYYVKDLVKPD